MKKFGLQLHITREMGLDRFCIPAMSILINQDLNPHYDSMNPVDNHDDFTFSMNLQIPLTYLPPTILSTVKKNFPLGVPLCVVLYKRKALCNYAKRMLAIDQYAMSQCGRMKIVELLKQVNYDVDYVGRFFSVDRSKILQQFKVETKLQTVLKNKIFISPEAVDKMAFFSSLLQV